MLLLSCVDADFSQKHVPLGSAYRDSVEAQMLLIVYAECSKMQQGGLDLPERMERVHICGDAQAYMDDIRFGLPAWLAGERVRRKRISLPLIGAVICMTVALVGSGELSTE